MFKTLMSSTCLACVVLGGAARAQTPTAAPPLTPAPVPAAAPAPVDCTKDPDPYKNYACLDAYLGTGVAERFLNYYKLEWGHAGAPSDPTARPAALLTGRRRLRRRRPCRSPNGRMAERPQSASRAPAP